MAADTGPTADTDTDTGRDPGSPPRDPAALRALEPQRELLEAMQAGQLVLHYQPIVSLETFEIRGVEALLRWEHPVAGTLPPDDFLTGIAQAPVMRDITRHVLALACRDARRWPEWTVSVNVGAADVIRADFVDDVTEALETAGLGPECMILELTEQSVVQDIAVATRHLQRLRDLGVGVALDDFGTGYSSLLYLRELPITQVKIDRVFVSAVENAEEDAAIVESVVRLARTINVDVVAEGVETPTQARFLQSLGCPSAQGYLFAHPTPPEHLGASTHSEWVGQHPAARRQARRALTHDPGTVSLVRQLLSDGASLHTVAAALNRSGALTEHGTRWTARTAALLVRSLSEG
jgi:EAL domain-containing protein (putative c-di-GMP-specific phosphodiesterase class I)